MNQFEKNSYEELNLLKPVRVISKVVRVIIFAQIGLFILAAVLLCGTLNAVETGKDNLVTTGIVKIMEFVNGEEVPEGFSIASLMEGQTENPTEDTVEETQKPVTEEPEEPVIEDNKEVTYYATFTVPEGVNFDIMEDLDYICHDVFSNTLVPCLTDERVTLAGIVDFQSEYFTAMVVVDASLLESEEDIKRLANEQIGLAMNKWNEIMQNR